MTFTLESLLTSPAGFGLTSPMPVQRAICRAVDGLPLGELAASDDVQSAFGDVEALPVGERPHEVHVIAASRSGKSQIAAANIFRSSQIVDVSRVSVGDIVRISVLGLKLATNAIWTHLVQTMTAKPFLRACLMGEPTSDTLVIRHPGGRPIEVMLVPLDKWGASIISTFSGGVFIDEEPRMIGAEDGVKNWDHMHAAALSRLLPGAQIFGVGAPWGPFGPVYDLVQKHHGHPSGDLIVVRATGPQMNPAWWTERRQNDLRRTNPMAYRADCLGEFVDPEGSLLTADEIELATRQWPAELPPDTTQTYRAAIDPGTRANSWTLTIGHGVIRPGGARRYIVDLARQWTGQRSAPLSPDVVLGEIAAVARPYGIAELVSDQWSADALRDIARRHGLSLREVVVTSERKVEMFENLRTLLATARLELPPDPVLRTDLLSVRKRVTQQGIAIVLPQGANGRHADHASSLALLVSHGIGFFEPYSPPAQFENRRAFAESHLPILKPGSHPIDRIEADGGGARVRPAGDTLPGATFDGSTGGY